MMEGGRLTPPLPLPEQALRSTLRFRQRLSLVWAPFWLSRFAWFSSFVPLALQVMASLEQARQPWALRPVVLVMAASLEAPASLRVEVRAAMVKGY